MGICVPSSLKEAIDNKRGDIPRSTYISRILERQVCENNVENNQNQSRPLDKILLVPYIFQPQHVWELMRMDKDNIVTDICKDSVSVCYTINCNNAPTKSIKIPLNGTISCIVYVCNSCYQKYLAKCRKSGR
jgi:hypothetical protein